MLENDFFGVFFTVVNFYFMKCEYHKFVLQVGFYICKHTDQERIFLAPESSLMPSPSHSPTREPLLTP